MSEQHRLTDARGRLQRYERLEQSRTAGPIIAVVERFLEIDGATKGGLLSIQFFTTVIPLIIIGFAYFSGLSDSASAGDLFIRDLGLHNPLDDRVREAFGTTSGLQSVWSFFGLAPFLVMGIPMSIPVAAMFAQAWRRQELGMAEKLARGATWFALYLVTMVARQFGFDGEHGLGVRTALLVVALIPQWVFWSLTPALLVRDGGRGWRWLLLAGFAGVAIDGIVVVAVARMVFPLMLEGWTGFGPMGVAMTLITWCGVLAYGWVAIACVGAVIWERNAPAQTVIELQAAQPEPPAATS